MIVTAYGRRTCWAILPAILILSSCSTDNAPQKGTPAFYWAAAKETFATGDYFKTVGNLDNIVATENEYTARAQPWLLVMTAGMARGYMDLADSFESGARMNKLDPNSFRKQMSFFRGSANRLGLHFAETLGSFQKTKAETVPLAFPYPSGSPNPVLLLTKAGSGILPPATEIENAQKAALSRRVLLATCRAVGVPDDAAKTQEMFKAGNVQVPRTIFITAMATSLYEVSQLYSREKMDEPDKLKMFCIRTQDALKTIPESKQTKELNSKIANTLKRAKV